MEIYEDIIEDKTETPNGDTKAKKWKNSQKGTRSVPTWMMK